MLKIKSIADLRRKREEVRAKKGSGNYGGQPHEAVSVKVAMATCGIASGAREIMEFMRDAMVKRGIEAKVTQTGCMGYCYAEPTIEVTVPGKEPVVFGFVDLQKADDVIEKYIRNGVLVEGIIPVNYKTIDE